MDTIELLQAELKHANRTIEELREEMKGLWELHESKKEEAKEYAEALSDIQYITKKLV